MQLRSDANLKVLIYITSAQGTHMAATVSDPGAVAAALALRKGDRVTIPDVSTALPGYEPEIAVGQLCKRVFDFNRGEVSILLERE